MKTWMKFLPATAFLLLLTAMSAQLLRETFVFPELPLQEGFGNDATIVKLENGSALVFAEMTEIDGDKVHDVIQLNSYGNWLRNWHLPEDLPVKISATDCIGLHPDGGLLVLLKGEQSWADNKKGILHISTDNETWEFNELADLPTDWEKAAIKHGKVVAMYRGNGHLWDIYTWSLKDFSYAKLPLLNRQFQGDVYNLEILTNGCLVITGDYMNAGDSWGIAAVLINTDGTMKTLPTGRNGNGRDIVEQPSGFFLINATNDSEYEFSEEVFKYSLDGEKMLFKTSTKVDIVGMSSFYDNYTLLALDHDISAFLVLDTQGNIIRSFSRYDIAYPDEIVTFSGFNNKRILAQTSSMDDRYLFSYDHSDNEFKEGWPIDIKSDPVIKKVITSPQGIVGILSEAPSLAGFRTHDLNLLRADGSVMDSFQPSITHFLDAWISPDGYIYALAYIADNSEFGFSKQFVKLDFYGNAVDDWESVQDIYSIIAQRPDGKWLVNQGIENVYGEYEWMISLIRKDGSMDPEFDPIPIGELPLHWTPLPDGSSIFYGYSKVPYPDSKKGIFLVTPEGSVVGNFLPGVEPEYINSVSVQTDRILVTGDLGTIEGQSANLGAWLDMDGSLLATINDDLKADSVPSTVNQMHPTNASGETLIAYSRMEGDEQIPGLYQITGDGVSANILESNDTFEWVDMYASTGGEDDHFYVLGTAKTQYGNRLKMASYSTETVNLSLLCSYALDIQVNNLDAMVGAPEGVNYSLRWFYEDSLLSDSQWARLDSLNFPAGTYRIEAYADNEILAHKELQLIEPTAPYFLNAHESAVLNHGENRYFIADFDGHPYPISCTWYKDGEKIAEGPILKIENMDATLVGSYHAEIDNGFGITSTDTFVLTQQYFFPQEGKAHNLSNPGSLSYFHTDKVIVRMQENDWGVNINGTVLNLEIISKEEEQRLEDVTSGIDFEKDFYAEGYEIRVYEGIGILWYAPTRDGSQYQFRIYHFDGSMDKEFGTAILDTNEVFWTELISTNEVLVHYQSREGNYYTAPKKLIKLTHGGVVDEDFILEGGNDNPSYSNYYVVSDSEGYFTCSESFDDYGFVYNNQGNKLPVYFLGEYGIPLHISKRYGLVTHTDDSFIFQAYAGNQTSTIPAREFIASAFHQAPEAENDFIVYVSDERISDAPGNSSNLYQLWICRASNNWNTEFLYQFYGPGYTPAITISNNGQILVQHTLRGDDYDPTKVIVLNPQGEVLKEASYFRSSTHGLGSTNAWYPNIRLDDLGGYILSGHFSELNGNPANQVVRINSDGTMDNDYHPHINIDDFDSDYIVFATSYAMIVKRHASGFGSNTKYHWKAYDKSGNLRVEAVSPDPWVRYAWVDPEFNLYLIQQSEYSNTPTKVYHYSPDGTLDKDYNLEFGLEDFRYDSIITPDGKLILRSDLIPANDSDTLLRLGIYDLKTAAPIFELEKDQTLDLPYYAFAGYTQDSIFLQLYDNRRGKHVLLRFLDDGSPVEEFSDNFPMSHSISSIAQMGDDRFVINHGSSTCVTDGDGNVLSETTGQVGYPIFGLDENHLFVAGDQVPGPHNFSYTIYEWGTFPVVDLNLPGYDISIPQSSWLDVDLDIYADSIEEAYWTIDGIRQANTENPDLLIPASEKCEKHQYAYTINTALGVYTSPAITLETYQPMHVSANILDTTNTDIFLEVEPFSTWILETSTDMKTWFPLDGYPQQTDNTGIMKHTVTNDIKHFYRARRVE